MYSKLVIVLPFLVLADECTVPDPKTIMTNTDMTPESLKAKCKAFDSTTYEYMWNQLADAWETAVGNDKFTWQALTIMAGECQQNAAGTGCVDSGAQGVFQIQENMLPASWQGLDTRNPCINAWLAVTFFIVHKEGDSASAYNAHCYPKGYTSQDKLEGKGMQPTNEQSGKKLKSDCLAAGGSEEVCTAFSTNLGKTCNWMGPFCHFSYHATDLKFFANWGIWTGAQGSYMFGGGSLVKPWGNQAANYPYYYYGRVMSAAGMTGDEPTAANAQAAVKKLRGKSTGKLDSETQSDADIAVVLI